MASLRFPSPLIEPDVPISGIRLSDWLHRKAHGGRPLRAGVSRRHRGTSVTFASRQSSLGSLRILSGVTRLIANHRSLAPSKAHQKSGSFPPPALPGLTGHTTLSDSRPARRARHDVWSCDLRPERVSPDYPDHLSNVPCPLPRWIGTSAYVGCFPIPRGLPRQKGGSASTSSLSRPAQASLALRPAGSLDRPRRPLSRGFETASYPTAPLVSYQINRQLSGWHLPPLVFRAFGAHFPLLAISRSPGAAGQRPVMHRQRTLLRRGPLSQ